MEYLKRLPAHRHYLQSIHVQNINRKNHFRGDIYCDVYWVNYS